MDIAYLLLLQGLREGSHNMLTPFMEGISLFAVTYLIMIPVFVYWAVNKEKGLYTLASYYLCCGINAVVKLTACVYRPWIRDSRVIPAGDAIRTATGYSFPSGHTTTAGPIYGGLAVVARSWKRIVSVLCVCCVLITGFSRNYLGVHAPQDVLMGLAESVLALWVMVRLFRYVKSHPEKENRFLLLSFILGWLGILFITFKSYPMDYVDGKLLVDPQRMMNDGYGDIALLIVFPIARFVERKWVGFQSTGLKGKGLWFSLAGLIPLFLMIRYMKAPLDNLLGSHWGHFMYTFIIAFYCITLFPAILKLFGFEHQKKDREEPADMEDRENIAEDPLPDKSSAVSECSEGQNERETKEKEADISRNPKTPEEQPGVKWKVLAIIALALLLIVCILYALGVGWKKSGQGETTVSGEAMLSLWTEDAAAKDELIRYVEAVTREGGADYIPPVDRIAVFDLDGTLYCETDPIGFDYSLFLHRVTKDEDYRDRATEFEREVAEKIQEAIATGVSAKGLEVDHGRGVASAFSGMTVDEFADYIRDFREEPQPGFEGMIRKDAFYQPMLQVVDYLEANDFTVYIVSGTDRLIVRGIVDGKMNVPPRQIIGSDELIIARDQGAKNGLDYVFDEDDELILGGKFLVKNLKMNQVAVIAQEIGQQPVLAFGNSSSDAGVAEYVITQNPYRSLAFMVCCDDTERENGNIEKADKMYSLCEEFNWVPISMKNDWLTIYGDEVARK